MYPFALFQLLIHGGIFYSFCSLTETLRVGECITGAGGNGGPRGIFLFILNFGGSIGSTCASTILITLCLAPELKDCPCCEGVYLIYCAGPYFSAHLTGIAAAIFDCVIFSSALRVFTVISLISSSLGLWRPRSFSFVTSADRRSLSLLYTILSFE